MTDNPMRTPLSDEQFRLLERLIDEEVGGAPSATRIRRRADRSTAPLSFGQERLYFVDRRRPGSAAYVGSGALQMRGEVRADLLGQAVRALVDRHEILRTALVGSGGPADDRVEQRVLAPGEVTIDLPVREVSRGGVAEQVRAVASAGFDVTCPPLLRTVLLRVTDAPGPEWVLVMAVHHLAVDGWSMGILIRELGALYAGLCSGEVATLPEPALQYADFAAWQRETLDEDALAGQLDHWRGAMAGLPIVDIPTDRPRPAERTYAGDSVPLDLPPALVESLTGLGTAERVTLFMVLTAAWSLVLGRWSGRDDVTVGTPIAGRRRAELEDVVGFFVNTLPLRVRHRPDDTFRALLGRVRETATEAFANQDVPFERIVQELRSERDESGQTTIARHWLALHNTPAPAYSLAGLECRMLPAVVGSVRCDLSVQLAPADGGGLTGRLEYSTELFDRVTAERLAAAFHRTLTAAAGEPGRAVRLLSPLQGDEYTRVVRGLSGAGRTLAARPGLAQQFETWAEAAPDTVAVVCDATGTSLTYAELDRRAEAVAHRLREEGVGAETPVAVLLQRGPDLPASVLGILKAGAVYLPLDPGYPASRNARALADAAPRLVLTDHVSIALLPPGAPPAVCVADLPDAPRTAPSAPPGPDAAAYVLFTSGSTGRPKGVVATHAGLVNRLAGMQEVYRLEPGDRVLHKTALGFDVSLWELLWPLTTGATLVCARPDGHRDPDYLDDVLDRAGVTVCHFVPSMLRVICDTTGRPHPGLRLLLCGGEELSPQLAGRVRDRFPDAEFHNQYGPTEAVIDVTAGRVGHRPAARVPIGTPVPGAEVYILDDALRPQPVGVPGELYLGGVQLARGYLGLPARTAESFVPHPFAVSRRLYATADRARWLDDGSIEFLGRTDRQVKIRGNRVELGEIEAALRRHPMVTDAVVTARPDAHGQLRILGYAVVGPAAAGGLTPPLQDFLSEILPEPMCPAALFTLAALPVGPHGKVDADALPQPDPAPRAPEPDPERLTDVQRQVADICAELLEIDRIGLHESFYDRGGHSLLAIRAVSRIRAQFGVGVPIGRFIRATDVAAVAEIVEQRLAGGEPAGPARIPRISRGTQDG